MNDIFSIIRSIAENGFTWQETIIMSFFIIGATLSVLIIVRGGVSIFSLLLRMLDTALSKINWERRQKNED